MRRFVAVIAVGAIQLLAASARQPDVPLVPLESRNLATPPLASDVDRHPERFNVVYGHSQTQRIDWAHGRGYVHASVGTVWAALRNTNVLADRRQLRQMTVLRVDDHRSAVRFDLRCVTRGSPSITYGICWREAATEGPADAPVRVVARDDLVQPPRFFGIAVISTLSDSIVLEAVDDHTTSVSIIRHVGSVQSDPRRTARYLTDLYSSVLAKVHGQALPSY
jgi:hypothetical protein